MAPDAPDVEVHAGSAILGDCVPAGAEVVAELTGLRGGDVVRQITDRGCEERVCPPEGRTLKLTMRGDGVRFVRYEVVRRLAKGMPAVRVMVSNPVYFDGK